MNHFEGINAEERFNNDLLNETRKTNQLLSQLISHIKPKVVSIKKPAVKKNLRKKVQ